MAGLVLYALAALGSAVLLYAAYTIWDFVALHFVLPARPLHSYRRSGPEPTYALITGASAGIGFGVALELVRNGFGVILLGHLPDELAAAKGTLEEASPGAAVRTVVMDARTATPTAMEELVRSLDTESLQVSILINNVGGNPIELPPLRNLSTYSCADVDIVIAQNARFMARLTALMLPLLSRTPSRPGERSLILNMSSAGHVGTPYLAMYGATKGFNLSFSRGVTPNAPRWDSYGRCLVRTVDGAVRRGMRDLSPYWKHDLEQRIMPWLDEATLTTEVTKVIRRKKDAWDEYFDKTR